MLFMCYKKCSTCKKAKDFLVYNNIDFIERDIKEEIPSTFELESWIDLSGLNIDKFFNTSGNSYKNMQLKDKLKDLSKKEKMDLLSGDGMLIKRPILISKSKVVVGFKEKEWTELLKIWKKCL